jgi:DNA (cytosine-5)-methyltransferase 1
MYSNSLKSNLINKLTKSKLIDECLKLGIQKCKSKNKTELIQLIQSKKQIDTNDDIAVKSCSEEIIKTNTNTNTNANSLTFIDLFCGIGGFHQALQNINGKCVFACDIDESCRKTYEENYGLKPKSDITKVNIEQMPEFDVLCGGFPCQPFSKAGFQKGFDDNRGNLFFHMCDIIKHHTPKYLLLENVRNLASHDDGNTWKVIYEQIDKLGYYTYSLPLILNVLHFNVPQNRERVIIMCKRKDLGELPVLPHISSNPKTSITKNIGDFIFECDKEDNKKYIIDLK